MHIHLLGPSGSGTSSLGQALSKELDIPYFDSDDIFWEKTDPPFTTIRPVERRQETLKEIDSRHDSWIIGGSMLRWGDFLREKLDLILYLYVDKDTRIARLIARERQRFGNRIAEGNDMHENHRAFIAWAESYEDGGLDMRSKTSETAWINEAKCEVVKIEHEIPIAEEVALAKKALGEIARRRGDLNGR
jgi:adenylate kinase family enzyme